MHKLRRKFTFADKLCIFISLMIVLISASFSYCLHYSFIMDSKK